MSKNVLPSGPKGSFLFGNLSEMRRDPIGLLMRAAREHGDVSLLKLVVPVWLINRPDLVKHVLQDNHRNYTKAKLTVRIKPLVGEGLLTSDGEYWRRQRRLVQPAFHRERLTAFAAVMAAETESLLGKWGELTNGSEIDVMTEMMRLTLRIIGRTMFGVDLDGASGDVGRALTTALEITNDRFNRLLFLPSLPTPSNLRFNRALTILERTVATIIAERRGADDRGDLLSMLVSAEDAETGEKMTDRQLRDEVMTMLLAGHETTANVLAWTFAELARDHGAAERVYEEARSLDGPPSFTDLPRLPYALMAIQEAMRLHPPVWVFARSTKEADVVGDWPIPAGASLLVSPYVLHRHPTYWESPETFNPLRFSPERAASRPKSAYVPFSAGPRQCIGNAFALMESQIVLAMIARRWRLELPEGARVEEEPSVTLRPKGGLRMRLCRR